MIAHWLFDALAIIICIAVLWWVLLVLWWLADRIGELMIRRGDTDGEWWSDLDEDGEDPDREGNGLPPAA